MTKFVLVAIGGSGMRVAQSLVALAASGYLSDLCQTEYKLELRLVDLDIVAGGDRVELEEMIRSVNEALPYLSVIVDENAERPCWKPKGIDAMERLSTPINDRSTLDDLVGNDYLTGPDALAFHALFGGDDRAMELRRGCKGRPRIGSLIWAEQFDREWNDLSGFWRSIFSGISTQDELRVMFVGSVFGGTGASGAPTLARRFVRACRNENNTETAPFARRVALTLMLPYFDIGRDTDVDSGLFVINSKMALKYYEMSDVLSELEFAQFVGDDRRQMEKKKEDGTWAGVRLDRASEDHEGQDDPSMPAELMAAIGICRYFAGDLPASADAQSKVYVPLKWVNSDPTLDIPPEAAFPLTRFEFFPASHGLPGEMRIASVQDYILRLERFCLMLGVYYRVSGRCPWNYRPEVLRTVWGRQRNLHKTYDSRTEGVGVPLAFTKQIFRWLEELDHHGMNELLKIEGNVLRNTPLIYQAIQRVAREGSTACDMLGIPCARITSQMNSARVDPEHAVAYFVSSLAECCVRRA